MAKVAQEKLFSATVKERRATSSFEDVPIPGADLEKIVLAGWRPPAVTTCSPGAFVVVRDREQRKKLRVAAFGQPKVEEASAVIVACGEKKKDAFALARVPLPHRAKTTRVGDPSACATQLWGR